jgi:dUTP pyrophosphatase
MTIISEKQAYIMGWVYKQNSGNFVDPENRLRPVILNEEVIDARLNAIYQVPEYKILEKLRQIDFLRGVFDRVGEIKDGVISLKRTYIQPEMLNCIDAACDISKDEEYRWTDINALEFMATLYYKNVTHYRYENQAYLSSIAMPDIWGEIRNPAFKWAKGHPDAVPPTKNRFSDSGYDLTVISKLKEKNGVYYYDTGIKVQPDNGYYFEIVGRSSISKSGWMLANNVGIIDASYRGNIIVALVRVNPDASEIELPMRLVQLIPRQLILMHAQEVDQEELSNTTRGEGGFGSSGC